MNAIVATVRCSISVLEKCQTEPLWTVADIGCGSLPNSLKNGSPPCPTADDKTTLTCVFRLLPSSLAEEWLGGVLLLSSLSKGSSSIHQDLGSLFSATSLGRDGVVIMLVGAQSSSSISPTSSSRASQVGTSFLFPPSIKERSSSISSGCSLVPHQDDFCLLLSSRDAFLCLLCLLNISSTLLLGFG